MRKKILHLIPYDGIGGVEEAARSMSSQPAQDITFSRRYIFPYVNSQNERSATNNLFRIIAEARAVAKEKPDLLVVSLWRAALAGIIVKMLNPDITLILFIHNSSDSHIIDKLVTRLALHMSNAIWTDSQASVDRRFRSLPAIPVQIISFLARRLEPMPLRQPEPVFVYWGRLSKQKNLHGTLRLFAKVRSAKVHARLSIIGPDAGERASLENLSSKLGLKDSIEFLGPLPFERIRDIAAGASFYLQTSFYEGMAMSVTEAMQLGLVPVVTPVGEIENYCNLSNSIMIYDRDEAVNCVLGLLDDATKFSAMRRNAIDEWKGKPLYRDSIIDAVRCLTADSQQNS